MPQPTRIRDRLQPAGSPRPQPRLPPGPCARALLDRVPRSTCRPTPLRRAPGASGEPGRGVGRALDARDACTESPGRRRGGGIRQGRTSAPPTAAGRMDGMKSSARKARGEMGARLRVAHRDGPRWPRRLPRSSKARTTEPPPPGKETPPALEPVGSPAKRVSVARSRLSRRRVPASEVPLGDSPTMSWRARRAAEA